KADKIIVYGRDHEFIALVDYKTYAKSFHPDDIQYGLDIQLPFYSLLIKRDSSFVTSTISGIYLSPLTFNKKQRGRVGSAKYGTDIRLDGVMVDDPQSKAEFDPGSDEGKPGKYVKILTKKVDENGNIEGLVAANDLQHFEDETLQKIKEADKRIHENDFRINPVKRFEKGNEKDGCTYCSYRHVCFVKNKQWHFIGSSNQDDSDFEEEEDYGE
ncbi:MAG: PD-(D/E)XK nuclease family protein, partial [Bacilli bacterium]|nr:PD-(D/E)XK nuclease family protein [Bacilli bacterium]